MLKRLQELPDSKEKRILVSGEGQESFLVTYFLLKNKRLMTEVPNLSIFLLHKKSAEQKEIEDVD